MRASPLSFAALIAVAAPRAAVAQAGGSLQTCLAAATDYSPVHPTNVFTVTSPELAAVFRLRAGRTPRDARRQVDRGGRGRRRASEQPRRGKRPHARPGDLALPDIEEDRALEDEALPCRYAAQSVQESLNTVAREHEPRVVDRTRCCEFWCEFLATRG